jgi:magnesium transporter
MGIRGLIHTDFPLVHPEDEIQEVMKAARDRGLSHKIIYFYVVDQNQKLLGVLPTRTVLTAPLNQKVESLYVRNILSLSVDINPNEARQSFAKHKFLAFPVVDQDNTFLGVLDIEKFAGNLGDVTKRTGFDDVYELLGISAETLLHSTPFRSFKIRFPWMVGTLLTGFCCALLATAFETTLQHAVVIAIFLTMVLGLSESVAMQSASITLQRLHRFSSQYRSFRETLLAEFKISALLGSAFSFLVGALVFVKTEDFPSSLVVGMSVFLTMTFGGLWGFIVPYALKRLSKDPKIASAPIVLGLTDLTTLFTYFSLGREFL